VLCWSLGNADILRNSRSCDHGSIGAARGGREVPKNACCSGVNVQRGAEMRAAVSLVGWISGFNMGGTAGNRCS
jgi:hypothetical protein